MVIRLVRRRGPFRLGDQNQSPPLAGAGYRERPGRPLEGQCCGRQPSQGPGELATAARGDVPAVEQELGRSCGFLPCGSFPAGAKNPRTTELVERDEAAAAERVLATLVVVHEHELAWIERRRWVCLRCSTSCEARRRRVFLDTPCGETMATSVRRHLEAKDLGHRPLYSLVRGTKAVVTCCDLCGCYAEASSVGLARPCAGEVSGGPIRVVLLALEYPFHKLLVCAT